MANWKDRRDPVRLLGRRFGIAALMAAVVVAAGAVWNVYQKERGSRERRIEAENQLHDLKAREARLAADIAALQSERGLEEVLRDQYEVAKEGERLLIIVEPASSAPVQATSSVLQWFRGLFHWW